MTTFSLLVNYILILSGISFYDPRHTLWIWKKVLYCSQIAAQLHSWVVLLVLCASNSNFRSDISERKKQFFATKKNQKSLANWCHEPFWIRKITYLICMLILPKFLLIFRMGHFIWYNEILALIKEFISFSKVQLLEEVSVYRSK